MRSRLASSAGSSARASALGRAFAVHRTELGSVVSAALAKSHPPALREGILFGGAENSTASRGFEPRAVALKVRVAT